MNALSAPRFRFKNLFWLSRGYSILKVNFAGSTSFGQNFRKVPCDEYLTASVDDLEDAVLSLEHESQNLPTTIFGAGFSYGASCIVQLLATTDLLSGGIAMHGIYDYESAYATQNMKQTLTSRLGKPWESPENYEKASPINNAHNIGDPLLLITGENDSRGSPQQSEQLYTYLADLGTDVTLHTYPDVGSSVYRPAEVFLDRLEKTESWLVEHSSGGDQGE